MNSFGRGLRNGSTKLWVAPLSPIIVRTVSSGKKLAVDRAVVVATSAPNAPCRGSAEVTSEELVQSGALQSQELLVCQLVPQESRPSLQLTRLPQPRKHPALNENPNVCGSGLGSGCGVCARRTLPMLAKRCSDYLRGAKFASSC